jgi:hypothetical protein
MEKSIEAIWKQGFLESNALIAPKLNNLYSKKSIDLVDKFKRVYKINIRAIIIFAFLVLPFSIWTEIPYLGIPMALLFVFVARFSHKFKNRLDDIDKNVSSYQYIKSFDIWIKDMISFNAKMSRYLYPYIFLSMLTGFWFGGFGGNIPGEDFVNNLIKDYPEMYMLFGLPVVGILGVIVILFLLAFFGGRIGTWDINLVYGRILKKLDGLLAEMEELRG